MTKGAKNRPQDNAKNRPQDELKNRPDIINPVSLWGVVSEAALKSLLIAKRQTAWCTPVRLRGLLMLIDYICRHLKRDESISISANLAHSYVSKLRNRTCNGTVTEPLLLLCQVGILQKIRPAVFAHVKVSALYCVADPYSTRQLRVEVVLTPKLANKRRFAGQRCEDRLNRKYPFRKQLLEDLETLSFSNSARRIIAIGLPGKGGENLKRLVTAIDAQGHFVKVSERGQITTSIGSCPRELQPHLLLHDEKAVACDISNAHWNCLPLILAKRLHHVLRESGREKYIMDGWREHNRLIALLSEGDFYRAWCLDAKNDTERREKKDVLTILLNKKNEDCQQNRLYQRIVAEFPITFAVIEDIKRDDHRNLSKQLHRFTADAIAAALLEVQQKGIAAIPNVDALICQEQYREQVCEIIGRQIFEVTGVCCAVGSIRYSPLTENEKKALAFDEIAPSDDGMSYDEWENMRALKTVAASKLTRFTRQAVSVTGFHSLPRTLPPTRHRVERESLCMAMKQSAVLLTPLHRDDRIRPSSSVITPRGV
jgi:hypothetical protein